MLFVSIAGYHEATVVKFLEVFGLVKIVGHFIFRKVSDFGVLL
jgi:hypothetical protein